MTTLPPVIVAPPVMRTPPVPLLAPCMLMPRIRTAFRTSAPKLSKLTMKAVVVALSDEPKTSEQSTVRDLVMLRVPKPLGSRQLISPFTAVLEIAPAKVLHGAVRLHGFTSSPTPETQVARGLRLSCCRHKRDKRPGQDGRHG